MTRFRYPRTPHLPFSPGSTSDDKVLRSTEHLKGKEVVTTLKMDGEGTTLYRDGFHARSPDSRHHPSRNWVKAFHARIASEIPDGWRICGENVYAQHSLVYHDLPSYFFGFSVWNERNVALSWDDTVEFFELLGIEPVKVLYRGPFDEQLLKVRVRALNLSTQEGLVVRTAGEVPYDEFGEHFAKWVRQGHVTSDSHWMHQEVKPNYLSNAAQAKMRELHLDPGPTLKA